MSAKEVDEYLRGLDAVAVNVPLGWTMDASADRKISISLGGSSIRKEVER
jgi:hypothetical protein